MSHSSYAAEVAMFKRRATRAVEHLMGLVSGMISDADLNDKEIIMLRTWLTEHPEATTGWPGSVIARKLQEIMSDGLITADERAHLLKTLHSLTGNDFSLTGSSAPEVAGLPIEDAVTITLAGSMICLTGEFLFGTRAACERLVLAAGAMCADNVSRKVDILAVGTNVSPDWAHTSFGRKIQRAVELQDQGHPIEIISEKKLLDSLSPQT